MKHSILILTLLSLGRLAYADFSDSLYSKQWALKNSGQSIVVETGKQTRVKKFGTENTDLGHRFLTKFIKKDHQAKDLVVAVIDSGLDLEHPELKGRLWFNEDKCAGLSEEDKQGKPCHGWNFADNNGDLSDTDGHGTHVAGIIAANADGKGIVGATAKNVKIMPLKVITKDVDGFIYKGRVVTDIFADAIRFAVENGAKVINLSLGWPKILETPKIKVAITNALKKNIAVVAASGNNYKDIPTFPCSYEGVICVGAYDNRGELSSFSNHGGKIDILAPGEFIVSTFPRSLESRSLRIQGYAAKNGSSQAAPYISAILANLWTVKPEATLDQVKSALYSQTTKKDHYSKHGYFQLKQELDAQLFATRELIAPDFKDLLDVEVKENNTFAFKLPIKKLSGTNVVATLSAHFLSSQIELTNSLPQIDLPAGGSQDLVLQGRVLDTSIDSHVTLNVDVTIDGETKSYQTLLVFNRSIDQKKDYIEFGLEEFKAENIFYLTKKRKGSFLRPIIDQQGLYPYPEFFFYKERQKGNRNLITLVKNDGSKASGQSMEATLGSHVIAVYRKDYNLDGRHDYMVYSKGSDNKNLYLHFLDQDLNPLYGKHSVWTFPISVFGGLPEHESKETFHWIKHTSKKLGTLLVPVIFRRGEIPDEDNTDDILDRLEGEDFHHYYLMPMIKGTEVILKKRILDSFNFIDELSTRFDLMPNDVINMSAPLGQTLNDIQKGILNISVAVGEEFNKSYYHVTFSNTHTWQVSRIRQARSHLDRNNIFPLFHVDAALSVSDYSQYFTLFNQQHARLATVEHKKKEVAGKEFKSSSWQDPLINYIAGFITDEKQVTYLTSRYSMYVLENGEAKAKLPVNRESSFTPASFTETFKPVVLDVEKGITGVYTDATTVYGDRVYFMKWDNDEFTRPIDLSFVIPRLCTPLGPVRWGAEQKMVLQCYNPQTKSMILRLYSLAE